MKSYLFVFTDVFWSEIPPYQVAS